METGRTGAVPADIEELRQQFESWQNAHARRSRIPETLWASAVKLARQYGLHRTAKALHLNYTKLKMLVSGRSAAKRKETALAFVEWRRSHAAFLQCSR